MKPSSKYQLLAALCGLGSLYNGYLGDKPIAAFAITLWLVAIAASGDGPMIALRWWLFKKISRVGWWVCPEPQRSRLYASMSFDTAMWKNVVPCPQKQGETRR